MLYSVLLETAWLKSCWIKAQVGSAMWNAWNTIRLLRLRDRDKALTPSTKGNSTDNKLDLHAALQSHGGPFTFPALATPSFSHLWVTAGNSGSQGPGVCPAFVQTFLLNLLMKSSKATPSSSTTPVTTSCFLREREGGTQALNLAPNRTAVISSAKQTTWEHQPPVLGLNTLMAWMTPPC